MRRIFTRSSLAAAVLALPVALTLPSTVRKDVDATREHARLGDVEANVAPPFEFAGYRNVPLLLGIRRRVPPDVKVAFVSREPSRVYLQTGWIRWAAFAIAPRLVVADPNAEWTVFVHRPPPHGVRHVWRFGPDSLVQR